MARVVAAPESAEAPPKRRRFLGRASWAGFSPNGVGQVKPNHYLDMAKVVWRNRDNLPYAWRVLSRGVCDGCALGTTGLRDHTMDGVHLCLVRLNLLRLNTIGALDEKLLADVAPLRSMDGRALRDLGRLPYPMVRRHGQPGFSRISWEEAMTLAAEAYPEDRDRAFFFLTSRGLTNESYYVAQKMVRLLGSNQIDNSSRICHAPSTTAMKATIGVAASTCSYVDWIGADLVVFFGAHTPNNQPVTTKYLYMAKQEGTQIAVVNPYREPGLERYWVPSVAESALFGTKLTDHWFQVHTGGDIAFIMGVLKALVEIGATDTEFISKHTEGWAELEANVQAATWSDLETSSGASEVDMRAFATLLSKKRKVVFVWSMGLTQHPFGTQNVEAVVDLALALGAIGKPHAGVMPIRGHSGVQGSAEMGAVPDVLPGGVQVTHEAARARFEALWGFPVPPRPGRRVAEALRAAKAGEIDLLWSVGGNFMETMPDPNDVAQALAGPRMRIHQDIVLSSMMWVDPPEGGIVLLLPSMTRYEQPGGGTETTTERRVYFSPEIPGHRIGEARSEWEIFQAFAHKVLPNEAPAATFKDAQAIREEIAQANLAYEGIQDLKQKGDAMQWGGRLLCEGGAFPLPRGKAQFAQLSPPNRPRQPDLFVVSTRRGRQFNSMVERDVDPMTGAGRDAVFMHQEDIARLGLSHGDAVVLESDAGRYVGHIHAADIRPGNLQVHWPEGNLLLPKDHEDERSGTPDYNALVRVRSATDAEGAHAHATVEVRP